jgi:hypothetical protein
LALGGSYTGRTDADLKAADRLLALYEGQLTTI